MSWTAARQFTRTLGFRLSVGYGALFVAGSMVLFGLIWYLLRVTMDRKDREMVETRLDICAAIYTTQGLEALREWIMAIEGSGQEKAYFLRLTDGTGAVLLYVVPRHWDDMDLRMLEPSPLRTGALWRRVEKDEFVDLSILAERLSDGALMEVARRTSSHGRLLHSAGNILAAVLAPTALVGLAIGLFLTRRITEPLRKLAAAVGEIIDTRRLEVRVPTRKADDELQDLIMLFNRMLDQNEQTLRFMKESLDNVAHDLRTPLTRLRGIAETALRADGMPGSCAPPLEECIAETERIQQIVETLLEVARAEGRLLDAKLERVDVETLVGDALALYDHVAEETHVALRFTAEKNCYVIVDTVRMRRAFANLLDNAVRYTPPGGSVAVSVQCSGGEVAVRIRDSGQGISEEDLPRIWERLYRAEKSRAHHGLGLGLSLVKAIVEANDGRVTAQSRLGEGSEFTVTFPIAKQAGNAVRHPAC